MEQWEERGPTRLFHRLSCQPPGQHTFFNACILDLISTWNALQPMGSPGNPNTPVSIELLLLLYLVEVFPNFLKEKWAVTLLCGYGTTGVILKTLDNWSKRAANWKRHSRRQGVPHPPPGATDSPSETTCSAALN